MTIFLNFITIFFMMTSSNEAFSTLLALCEGNPPVTCGFPSQRPVTRSFHVFFDLRLTRQWNKQPRRWWLNTPSRSLWRHFNVEENLFRVVSVILEQPRGCHGDSNVVLTLQWRHNERNGVWNHQPHDYLLNAQIKENIKAPRHWSLWGEFTGDRWTPRTKGQ